MIAVPAEGDALVEERPGMNHGQFLVLWFGICIVVLMGLFPPQIEISASQPEEGRTNVYVEPAGYDFIFSDNDYMLNLPRLCIQWCMVAAITFVLYMMLKGKDQAGLPGGNVCVIDAKTRVELGRCQVQKGKTNRCRLISGTDYRRLRALTMNKIALCISDHTYYDTGRSDERGRAILTRRRRHTKVKKGYRLSESA